MNYHVKAYKNNRLVGEQIMIQPKSKRIAVINFLKLGYALEFDSITVQETEKEDII